MIKSLSIAYVLRFMNILINFISIPLIISYFGTELFGFITVLLAFSSLVNLSDLGLGNTLITLLPKESNPQKKTLTISIAVLITLIISIFIFLIIIIINLYKPDVLLNIVGYIPKSTQHNAKAIIMISFLCFIIRIPLNTLNSAFSGLQLIYLNQIYSFLYSIASTIAFLITFLLKGELEFYFLIIIFSNIIIGFFNVIHISQYLDGLQLITYKVLAQNSRMVIDILKLSINFFIAGISSVVILNIDALIINHYSNSTEVALYSICLKVFTYAMIFINLPITLFWPYYAEAFHQNNFQWLNRTKKTLLKLQLFGSTCLCLFTYLFIETILQSWTHKNLHPDKSLILVLGGVFIVSSIVGVNIAYINAMKLTRLIILFGIIEAIISLTFSIYLIDKIGITGVAIAKLIGSVTISLLAFPIYLYYKTNKKIKIQLRDSIVIVSLLVLFILLSNLFSKNLYSNLFTFVSFLLTLSIIQYSTLTEFISFLRNKK